MKTVITGNKKVYMQLVLPMLDFQQLCLPKLPYWLYTEGDFNEIEEFKKEFIQKNKFKLQPLSSKLDIVIKLEKKYPFRAIYSILAPNDSNLIVVDEKAFNMPKYEIPKNKTS